MNQRQNLKHNEHTSSHAPPYRARPRWNSSLYGYAMIFPLALLLLLAAYMVWYQHMPITYTQLYILLLLIVTIVTAIWGIGPSICLLLVGVGLIIDLFLQPFLIGRLFPQISLATVDMKEGLSALLFVLTGATLSIIVHQREQARIYARKQEMVSRMAHQQLEEFISIICHELKTPLAGTLGNIQFAQRKIQKYLLPVSETVHLHSVVTSLLNTLLYAERSVKLETRLVDDLLDASRIQRNTFQIRRRDCNLVDCINQAIARFEGTSAKERIIWKRPVDSVLVCSDPDRLEQVISNYLSNAFRYGGELTPVIITLTLDKHAACVAVHDEGPGLSEQEQQRVWDRFYRDQTRKEITDDEIPHVGLGIGLSLCLAIIEQHEGQVGVESTPGEGTTFWFSLPYGHSRSDNSPSGSAK